ncbi:hypothetical protein [Chitinophaga sp. Cy-1792]|uniref:hypothetical protein n=1 Tax=Chitinophaga sp. Cy-1792 TaxID=2608339 RepID=UPI0014209848|nr:hypothetical protein [Chitinophaga sp. Cy-1792]NIG53104.1 hypothetical protein [Chitinophaga sp. Cy-1792]
MYKKYWHRLLAILLLGVFTLNTLPREFIHEFANHHDTHDVIHPKGESSVSTAHRHCEFLQIGVEPYDEIVSHYIVPVQKLVWVFLSPTVAAISHQTFRDLAPRAPPVA